MPELATARQADLDVAGESRFATTGDGLRLHVLDAGGGGRPLLVLPGITSPAVTWRFMIDTVAAAGHRVLVADLRGRGLSDAPAEPRYALDDYADDVAAIVTGLELERPLVLGHSLGARIAAAFAIARPGLAGQLILVDPPLSGPGRDPYPTTRAQFLEQLQEAEAGTDAAGVARFYPGWPEAERALRARWLPTCREDAVLATHAGFEQEDFLPLWRELAGAPVLIRGGDSPVVTDAGLAELEAALPSAVTLTVAGAGHMVPWDQPDAFAAALLPHLRRDMNTTS
jgi:N-formylmaleamate deformylase